MRSMRWTLWLKLRVREIFIYIHGLYLLNRTSPKTFIIFAQGRTGSTLLVDLLRNGSEIFTDGEIMGSSMPFNVLFKRFYIRALGKIRAKGKRYYGYRIKIYEMYQVQHLSPEAAIAFLRARIRKGAKVIYLYRTNHFRQAISSLVAEARNRYHQKGDSSDARVYIDVSLLPQRVEHLKYFTTQEMEVLKGFEHVRIHYESDLLDATRHQIVADKIADYLGIETFKAKTAYSRTTSDKFVDFIENHEEVSACATQLGYD